MALKSISNANFPIQSTKIDKTGSNPQIVQTERALKSLKPANNIGQSSVQISEPMRYHMKTMSKNIDKLEHNISKMQTADKGLQTTEKALHKMKELAVKATDESLSIEQRTALNDELKKMRNVVDQTANKTSFDKQKMLDGKYTENIQTGASKQHTSKVKIGDMSAKGVGVTQADLSTADAAKDALADINKALKKVGDQRKHIGGAQAKMEQTVGIQSTVISKLNDISVDKLNAKDAREELTNLREKMTSMNSDAIQNLLKVNNNQAFNLLFGTMVNYK